jgi:Protein of unknown function (DUF4231)
METTVTPPENTDDFTQAIDAARAIKAKYVDDRLQWYTTHKALPRVLYRLVGIVTVILSVTLPALTAATFRNKDVTISCISIVIAALTGLGSFYHWDRTWQKNATAQASIEAFLAKWELELARAKELVAPADRTKHVYDATDDLIANTSRVISSETQDFFNNLQPAQQNTAGKTSNPSPT